MADTGRRTYLTDDADIAQGRPMELSLLQGGNGDWYLSVEPQGTRLPRHVVRITTSGSLRPMLPRVMRDLYEALELDMHDLSKACPCCGRTNETEENS